MITELHWLQHPMTMNANDLDGWTFINPQKNRYIIIVSNWHLCDFHTDGTDEGGDIQNAVTLCRLHYQHSFSGERNEKTT